ncbi:MAG: hypothetical protein ACI4QM_01240 [Alphaproteobacteria bacterium]
MIYTEQLIELVKHLYPTSVYPQNQADRTIGHTCMAYFDKHMPREHILTPSWVEAVLLQKKIKGQLSNAEIIQYRQILELSYERLKAFRLDRKRYTTNLLRLIKARKVANCQEFGDLTRQWFDANGIPNQEVTLKLYNAQQQKYAGHVFVLFHTKKPRICANFKVALNYLTDTDLYIADLWMGQCAPAISLINQYLNLFVNNLNPRDVRPAQSGDTITLQRSFQADHSAQDPDWNLWFQPQQTIIGHVGNENGIHKFVPDVQRQPIQHHNDWPIQQNTQHTRE